MTDEEAMRELEALSGDAVMLVTAAEQAGDALAAVADLAGNLNREEAQVAAAVLALSVVSLKRQITERE